MKKRTRNLLIAVAVLIVLAAAAYFLLREPESTLGESSAADATVLFESKLSDIKSLTVENGRGGYVMELTDEGFKVAGTDGVPMNSSLLSTITGKMKKITALRFITDDLSKKADYGLNEPSAKVTLKTSDDGEKVILFGDSVPGNAGMYAECDGKIYVLDATEAAAYMYSTKLLCDMALTPTVDLEEEVVVFGDFELSGTSRTETVKIRRLIDDGEESTPLVAASSFEMTEPHRRLVSISAAENIFNSLLNINATEVVELHPSEETVKEYGLSEPYSSVMYTLYEDTSFAASVDFGIWVSEPEEDGMCYAMIKDSTAIYRIKYPAGTIFDATYKDILDNMPILPYIVNVSTVDIAFGGENYRYRLAHGENNALSVTCNGKEIDADNFRKMYQMLLSLNGEEFVENAEDVGESYLTVTYGYINEDFEDNVVELFPAGSRRYYIAFDGAIDFTTRAQRVDDITEAVGLLLEGKDVEVKYY